MKQSEFMFHVKKGVSESIDWDRDLNIVLGYWKQMLISHELTEKQRVFLETAIWVINLLMVEDGKFFD